MLIVLVVAGVVVFLLLRRSRAHRAWDQQMSTAREEIGWFARDLVPQLRRSGSAAAVATGWGVAASRMTALEDSLSMLVATAPGTAQRNQAIAVRDAVRTSRHHLTALAADGGSDWQLRLDEAQSPLLAALVPPSSEGPSSPS